MKYFKIVLLTNRIISIILLYKLILQKEGKNMEEKKSKGISISGFFLIITIIVIIAMGYFIYKFYNDKANETKRATDLQAQVDSLNGTVSELQGKINGVSVTVSDNVNISENINDDNKKSISGYFSQAVPGGKGAYYDAGDYIFENDGTVENANSGSRMGTYVINGNIINIHFTEGEGEVIDEYKEFLIKDDDTLLSLSYKIDDSGIVCNVTGTVFYRQNDDENNVEDIILNGDYMQGTSGDEVWSFSDDNKVFHSAAISSFKGTYKTIDRNMIEVHFTEEERDDLDNPPKRDTYTIDEYYKISIIDNNSIKIVDTNQELHKTTN